MVTRCERCERGPANAASVGVGSQPPGEPPRASQSWLPEILEITSESQRFNGRAGTRNLSGMEGSKQPKKEGLWLPTNQDCLRETDIASCCPHRQNLPGEVRFAPQNCQRAVSEPKHGCCDWHNCSHLAWTRRLMASTSSVVRPCHPRAVLFPETDRGSQSRPTDKTTNVRLQDGIGKKRNFQRV